MRENDCYSFYVHGKFTTVRLGDAMLIFGLYAFVLVWVGLREGGIIYEFYGAVFLQDSFS